MKEKLTITNAKHKCRLRLFTIIKLKFKWLIKKKNFLKYKKIFKNFEKLIEIKCEPKNCKSNYWLNTILLKKADLKFRNNIIKKLNDIKVFARPVWRLNHRFKYLSKYPNEFR